MGALIKTQYESVSDAAYTSTPKGSYKFDHAYMCTDIIRKTAAAAALKTR